jgi:hypothetical protein
MRRQLSALTAAIPKDGPSPARDGPSEQLNQSTSAEQNARLHRNLRQR